MVQYPEETILLRNVTPTLGQWGAVAAGEDGKLVANYTVGQTMVFDGLKEPRLLLGQENLLLQGFPINILPNLPNPKCFSEHLLMDLAGNMCTTTVLLAVTMSIMAAASWEEDPTILRRHVFFVESGRGWRRCMMMVMLRVTSSPR